MAISSGTAAHTAIVSVNGGSFTLLSGSVDQAGTRQSSTFSGTLPLGFPGAESAFASLGDNQASIFVTGPGGSGTLVTGEVDHAEFDYIGGVISFSGRCKSAKLHEKTTSEKWVNKTHAEIVQDLAGRVGLGADIDQSVALKAGRFIQIDWTKLTDSSSYAMVIQKAAEFMGMRWWVDPQGTLHMKPMGQSAGSYTINYRDGSPKSADVLSLKVARNIQAGKGVKVTTRSFHVGQKKTFTGTYTVGGNGTTQEYNYHLPSHTQDHVDQHAKAKAKEHARHALTLSAQMVGDPSLDPSKTITLAGTSFAGSFDIDSVRHSFGMSGYTMDISAKTSGQSGA